MERLDDAFAQVENYRYDWTGKAIPDASSGRKRKAKHDAAKRTKRNSNIAVLDFETDPFDARNDRAVFPFLAVLYSRCFDTVVIWDDEPQSFISKVIAAIERLPEKFTIYAHNGGKFDYMFFIHRLRGQVSFKGRGIMSCRIGAHELRDSFHIIPERLAGYKKDNFDYTTLERGKRERHRTDIIRYCINDCVYLLEIVEKFIASYGLKLTFGQAALHEWKKHYALETLSEYSDGLIRGVHTDKRSKDYGRPNGRGYFFGGRVECIAGKGHFIGDYRLFDVNSMYPDVMANYKHPIGNQYTFRRGEPNADTCFIHLHCRNYGALITRDGNNETSAQCERGEFYTTIHEYKVALERGLIDDVDIIECVDNNRLESFPDFVVPIYENRLHTKAWLRENKADSGTPAYDDKKKDDLFYKFLLNSGYGKFAQNPRRFREHYITDPDRRPPRETKEGVEDYGRLPDFVCDTHAIWSRPSPGKRFNNVGTGASITGAARSVLLAAMDDAIDPIYCDTDSLICKGFIRDAKIELHPTKLGAWDIEKEFEEVVVVGKKMYAAKVKGLSDDDKGRYIVKSKGVSGLKYADMLKLLEGEVLETYNPGPTLLRTGKQFYMRREVRSTARRQVSNIIRKRA